MLAHTHKLFPAAASLQSGTCSVFEADFLGWTRPPLCEGSPEQRSLPLNARELLITQFTECNTAGTGLHWHQLPNSRSPAALRVRKVFWEETDLTVRAPNQPELHQDSLTFLLFTVLYLDVRQKEFFSEQLRVSMRGMWISQFTWKGSYLNTFSLSAPVVSVQFCRFGFICPDFEIESVLPNVIINTFYTETVDCVLSIYPDCVFFCHNSHFTFNSAVSAVCTIHVR